MDEIENLCARVDYANSNIELNQSINEVQTLGNMMKIKQDLVDCQKTIDNSSSGDKPKTAREFSNKSKLSSNKETCDLKSDGIVHETNDYYSSMRSLQNIQLTSVRK